jgi:hypothetical protein
LVIDSVIYAPECPIRLISPQQLHRKSKGKGHENSCFTTEETTATLFHGGDTFTCDYHHKTKIPTLRCITDNKKNATYIQSASTLAQQPSNKGRKCVIFHENDNATTPAAYVSNLNTSQQELVCLHDTYAHAYMKEIQHQIKNCENKANRQVATCNISKCISCSNNKVKKRSHKQRRGSITKNDSYPGSDTSIDHVDASNVPGYTWKHRGRPTLKKYKISCYSLTTKYAFLHTPHFRNQRPHMRPVDKNVTMRSSHSGTKLPSNHNADNGAFRSEMSQKAIDNKNQHLNFSGVNAQWQNGLVERSNGTLCAAARSMLNRAISKWDKTITAEIWPFSIQHAATIYNTIKRRS